MRLINAEVLAYGAASGQLRGQIAALFYRHRSIGGYDDITDFLIAPLPGQAQSQPGDSGTVWHLVQTGEPTAAPDRRAMGRPRIPRPPPARRRSTSRWPRA